MFRVEDLGLRGHGDLANRVVMGIIGATRWPIGAIHLLIKSP